MTSTSRGRLVKMFGTAVIGQVMLSAVNFFVGFLLIRHTSDEDYGLYVLVQSAITLLVSAQAAWVVGPLAVLVPQKSPDQQRIMIGAFESAQRRLLLPIAALLATLPILGYAFKYIDLIQAIVIALAIAACWAAMLREYLRGVLLIYTLPQTLFQSDAIYAGILFIGTLLAVFGPGGPPVIWAVSALSLAAFIAAIASRRSIVLKPGWSSGDVAQFWPETKHLGLWSFVGAVIYWLFSQSFNYVLASRVDLSAVADVNAARLLLMPTFVLTIGIKSLLLPSTSRWLAEHGVIRAIRRLFAFAAGVALLDLIYFTIVWLARDWLTYDFLHKTIHDRDRLLVLWFSISLIGLFRDFLLTALFALGQVQSLAWMTAISASVALSLMWFGLSLWGPSAALIGQIAGELISLCGVIALLRNQVLKHSKTS
jgi:O-antigen/teichoic acid export membrane protein